MQIYLATVATYGVGDTVVGGDVGAGVGTFVGAPVVGGDVGTDVPAVGGGVGDGPGPASIHPLVVSKTADTGLEKLLLVSCSITQKNAPPLHANSPLL